MKIENFKNKRNHISREDRIKMALAKKPTAEFLRRQGLPISEVAKIYGGPVIKGKKTSGRVKKTKEHRPPSMRGVRAESLFIEPDAICVNQLFQTKDKIDVSVIVPLYKSQEVIKSQIVNWDFSDDGLTKEIIYVDDGCPQKSHLTVLETWTASKNKIPIKILLNKKNAGFPYTCNTGAKHASGKYVIFLNADCIVTPNWIKPMVDLLEKDQSIGLVGNLQVKPNGIIDSAGSEWSWDKMSFPHILQGTALKSVSLEVCEREMITAACIALPKNFFYELEGFDTQFRISYWEDADLCMRIHRAGKKIMFQPNSMCYHQVGHAKSWGHPYQQHNRDLFASKWVNTGMIDQWIAKPRNNRKPRTLKSHFQGEVIGCVIACNEEEFLEASVDSVSPIVDKWIIVIGGNEYAYKSGMCHSDGLPTDNTREIAHALVSKYGGVVIEPPGRLWKDKIEMRNAYAEKLQPKQWMFMVDGDEVYKQDQLWKVANLMRTYEVLILQFWVFWNTINTLGTEKWEQYPQERVVKWKDGYGYKNSHLFVSNANNKFVKDIVPCWRGNEKLYYHYSWVRPIQKIRQKLEYYKHQTGNNNDKYVDDVFLLWRQFPEQTRGKTHPMGGGNYTPFKGMHPSSVQKLIDEGKLNFDTTF